MVFDVVAPDGSSMLPDDIRLVMHTNPKTFSISYQKVVERIQTLEGWQEQHWGDAPSDMTFEATTGGFMRLYVGLVSTTGPTPSYQGMPLGGTRRETLARERFLDLLALFKHNGAVYDRNGNIAIQGRVKVLFDGGSWTGVFESFSVSEGVESPYQFSLSAGFKVERESHELLSVRGSR